MITCNLIIPQILWFKSWRRTPGRLLIVVTLVNAGMWWERFVIIVVSLHRAFLPSGWGMFYPTIYDVGILIGSFGLFFTCFLVFIRVLPMIAMWEIKTVAAGAAHRAAHHGSSRARRHEEMEAEANA